MLRLRPYKDCDAEYIVNWIKDERTFYKWCAGQYRHYPISAEDIREYYGQYAKADNYYQMTAFDESGPVGHLIMRFTDEEKKVLRFGFIVLNNEKRGKGYGKEMLCLALQYAFDILKVKKVTLGVFENNPAALHCYQSVGFQESTTKEAIVYHFLGEDWKCKEMEINSTDNYYK